MLCSSPSPTSPNPISKLARSYIMVVGEYPFHMAGNIMILFENISAGRYEVPDWVDPDCSDLISQMLQTNPNERIDLPAIRTHPFVKNAPVKLPPIPIPVIPSMWPHHDKSSLSSIVKKMKPLLEREEEQERAQRFSFDAGISSFDEDEAAGVGTTSSSKSNTSQSKCAIM